MIEKTVKNQLKIEEFIEEFHIKLDQSNRWIVLGNLLPWDAMEQLYYSKLNSKEGSPCIKARIVIGAMIIKHKLKLSDRECIEHIRENPYAQCFLGLSNYTEQDVFDRSLFTLIRNRIGVEEFDKFNCMLIEKAEEISKKKVKKEKEKEEGKTTSSTTPEKKKEAKTKPNSKELELKIKPTQRKEQNTPSQPTSENIAPPSAPPSAPSEQQPLLPNQGKLQIDATVADQMIVYPTDLGLLNRCREESERLIDSLHQLNNSKKKPRTYRQKARTQYLQIAKKKKKTKREIHKGIGQQLRFLKRDIALIHQQLDELSAKGTTSWELTKRDQKIFWVIQQIYVQQLEMYQNSTHSVANRIVNIYQPHVRPIVRGKEKTNVEFGSKLGVSLEKGFARINTFSWEAYNESTDLTKQLNDYKKLHGYYPEAVLADTLYGTRENRALLKELGIRFIGKALGRPPKEQLTPYQRRKQKKERNERNHIEGKFGQGKNGYNLSKIRAKLQKTSESWVSCIFFVMNIANLVKLVGKTTGDFLFSFFTNAFFTLKKLFFTIFAKFYSFKKIHIQLKFS